MRDADDPKDDAPRDPSGDDRPTRDWDHDVPPRRAADPPRTNPQFPALGQRYEILNEVGRGGMGIVYRARDHETGELVALKVLKPEIAAAAPVVERFKNELKLARKVTHKNVCRIHDFNRAADGSAFISMEYVEGDSLRHVLGRFGGLPLRKGIQVVEQMCAGLGEAHAQGVIHRDLKPENIMLDQAGNVKIMDFGIARSREATTALTGGMIGTPAYMSPEQAEGKPVDHRADIYSLGLIFYEMFTGSPAVTGETPVEVALKQIHETPASPRTVEPTLPANVEDAILKCLEKKPAKRFQSVDQLATAVARPTAEKPVAAAEGAEVTIPARLAFWQRSDGVLLVSAIAGLALFFGLFYRFHPASALQITVNDEEQKQIAIDLFKKLNWNVEIGKSHIYFDPEEYYYVAANTSDSFLRRSMFRRQGGISTWYTGMKVVSASGKTFDGDYVETTKGKVTDIGVGRPQDFPSDSTQGPPPDAAAMTQMKVLAQTALTTVFGPESTTGTYSEKSNWNAFHRWQSVFEWHQPLEPKGVYERCAATVTRNQIVNLGCRMVTWEAGWPDQGDVFGPPKRYALSCIFMLFLVWGLFLIRRVYQQPRSQPSFYLAALVAAAFVWTALGVLVARDTFTDPGGAVLEFLVPLLMFCMTMLFTYAALKTVLYYLRSRFPAYAAGYSMLFSRCAFEPPQGLAVLRGSFAGAAFGGLWMAALSVAGIWGKGVAGMLFYLGGYGPFTQDLPTPVLTVGSASLRIFPTGLFFEVLIVGCLLVALPLSLLGKATTQSRVLLAALAALWVALGFSLAGPMAFPRIAYYVIVAAQAVFFGWVFLRYGLVATLSAIFTVETILLAFPLLEIFQHIDPLPYVIPIALWLVLVTLSAAVAFRSQVVGAYRRVAAVFE